MKIEERDREREKGIDLKEVKVLFGVGCYVLEVVPCLTYVVVGPHRKQGKTRGEMGRKRKRGVESGEGERG